MRHKKLIALLVVVVVLFTLWLFTNPPGRFGWSYYGFSTYNSLPRFVSDFQIRGDGQIRKIDKTHDLSFDQIQWLLDPRPDVLIIAQGWQGLTVPDDRIRTYEGCEIHILTNKKAIDLYNRLKRAGKRVAIHYHSTC
ncbi:MAG: hypothetical protein IT445_04080 [Phycisphaeraceae bacterium]|nr:hypothetical protein [Phycisphaeraceae bacterium]